MRKKLLILLFTAGCASKPAGTDLIISNSGFYLDGTLYPSRSSLAAALTTKKITRIHLLPQKDAAYDQVKAALEAARDAGVNDVGIVGSEQSK